MSTIQNQSENQNLKYGSNSSPCNNILQPKRLNVVGSSLAGRGGHLLPRRILGQKGQLPIPVSHLSNQQLTTLLRNSPLLTSEGCGPGSGDCAGSHLVTSTGPKRAPNTMAKRNARERNRVKQVNQGFQTLRQHIPESYRMKKMSKVDTLRCALDYIRNMEKILQEDEESSGDGTQDHAYQPHIMSSTICPGDSSTVSPSTTVSFSSEDDDYLVLGAFSSDFTSSSSNPAPSPGNNAIVEEMEQRKSDLFGPSRIMIIPSSSNSPGYNDENNDENLHLDMKLEDEIKEHGIHSNSNHNPNPHRLIHIHSGEDHSSDQELGREMKKEQNEDQDVEMRFDGQSQGQRFEDSGRGSENHSDTENNFCPDQE